MMPFKLLSVLLLSVWALALSPPSLAVNESPSGKPLQDTTPGPTKSSQQKQTGPSQTNQDANTKQEDARKSLAVKPIPISPSTEPPRAQETQNINEPSSMNGILVYVATGATLLIAIFTGLLWYTTHRLVKGAEDTAQKQLRAYLAVSEAKIVEIPDNQPTYKENYVFIKVKNFGQTPATAIKYWVNIEVYEFPLTTRGWIL